MLSIIEFDPEPIVVTLITRSVVDILVIILFFGLVPTFSI